MRSIHFYPRSPCGERHTEPSSMCTKKRFLSTLSLRRATKSPANSGPCIRYFYPRSPCGERPVQRLMQCMRHISIHALLAESDHKGTNTGTNNSKFLSTLSLRRATPPRVVRKPARTRFLSTLSLRRATKDNPRCPKAAPNFYPRSPCGERRRPKHSANPKD